MKLLLIRKYKWKTWVVFKRFPSPKRLIAKENGGAARHLTMPKKALPQSPTSPSNNRACGHPYIANTPALLTHARLSLQTKHDTS